jgi:hypothetical protein
MSVKNKVEKLERLVGGVADTAEPCASEKCAALARAFDEAYGEPRGSFVIRHSPAVCNELHATIEKAYAGGGAEALREIPDGRAEEESCH